MSITYDTTTGLRALLGGNLVADIDTGFLSLAQDIAATLGHAMQEGVIDAGSFETTQASGGASMVLDVASNVGTGAMVQNDSATGTPLVYLPPTGAKTSVTATTAHATLPRVDAVVVSTAGVVSIVAGTPTSGATLDNARDGSHGGAVIPSNALHLADVLVPATDTTLSNSQIRDRRKWARGAHAVTQSTSSYSTSSGSYAIVDATNLNPRIECSGVVLEITALGRVTLSSGTVNDAAFQPMVDGVNFDAGGGRQFSRRVNLRAVGDQVDLSAHWRLVGVSSGSHRIGFSWLTLGGPIAMDGSTIPVQITVREIVAQNTANNPTTSG